MTPQELKNSILQLAIQGKLVEQRPEEGTGEELYRQIQQEKQKLIEEGKLKKEKPLPEVAEEEKPFEIPVSWMWIHFSDVTYSVGNKQNQILAKDVLSTGKYPAISQGAAEQEGFSDDEEKAIFDLPLVMFGDHTRNVKYIDFPFVISADGTKFLKAIKINTKYLFYWMSITAMLLRNRGYARHYSLLVRQPMPLPPFAEQKRIVAKIEELLPYIDRYKQAWSRLEVFNASFPDDMKKSILQLAMQGKLVEQRPEEGTGEELYRQIQQEKQKLIKVGKLKKEKLLPEIAESEKPFEIPNTWMWVRVGEVTQLNPKNNISDDIKTSFIPMALIADGYQDSYTTEIRQWGDIKKGFTHFAEGDIGIAKITPCFQNRKSVVFGKLENGYGAGTTELSIVRVIDNLIERKYLLYFFKSTYFIDNGVKSFTGTAGQQRIHKDYLSRCMLPLPPIAEQKRIVAKLEQLLPLCEKLKTTKE